MLIDYGIPGKVQITMADYIKKILEEIPDDMEGEVASPAANHLFEVNKDGEFLEKDRAELFHHFLAKLLFLSKRARPDILTAVAFLSTRVKQPDEDDYKKLERLMKYLRATVDLPLTLKSDGTGVINWWVDASFAVHPDMRSHTGGMMSLGRGAVYSGSKLSLIHI